MTIFAYKGNTGSKSFVLVAALLFMQSIALADPTVAGPTISWPDDGWYQVQDQNSYETVCEGGISCDVNPGTYLVINHSTGERFQNIVVTTSTDLVVPQVPQTGFVFSRTDADEFRYVVGTANVWIDADCASELGGATQTGDWSELNSIAPEFDSIENPCAGGLVVGTDVPSDNTSNGNGQTQTDQPGAGFVFSRTDTTEFRYVLGTGNVWIDEACAQQLGGASRSGSWSDLNSLAPSFDSIPNPCTSGMTNAGGNSGNGGANTVVDSTTGFVFSRTDADEFRYVSGNGNIWIDANCASQLGGATQSGTWSDLFAIAPNFDSIANPCASDPISGGSNDNGGNSSITDPGVGFVFSRSDSDEFRYVSGNGNIWIDAACARQLGGASQTGTWSDLFAIAPEFDSIPNPCAILPPIATGGGTDPGGDDPTAPVASIDNISAGESLEISGQVQDEKNDIAEVLIEIKNESEESYWNGTQFQNIPVNVNANLEIDQQAQVTSFTYVSPFSGIGTYVVSVIAIDGDNLSQQAADVKTFTISPVDAFDPEADVIGFETNRIIIATSRTAVDSVGFTEDAVSETVPADRQQLTVRDTTTDLWPRNTPISVGFFVDADARERFNSGCFRTSKCTTTSLPPFCSASETDSACFDKVTDQIIGWANGWAEHGSVSFVKKPVSESDIRVAFLRNRGSNSKLGMQDTLSVDRSVHTMNFDWLTKRVVLHEFGHALGFAHEQSNPDNPVIYNLDALIPHYAAVNGWSRFAVESQVLARQTGPYLETATPYDPRSIMRYPVFNFQHTVDANNKLVEVEPRVRLVQNYQEACDSTEGRLCIDFNTELSELDKAGMRTLYPRDSDLEPNVTNGTANFIIYSPNLTDEAHGVLYEQVPAEYRSLVLNGEGKIAMRIVYLDTRFDSRCVLGIGFKDALEDFYRSHVEYRPKSGEVIEVATRAFSIRGDRDVGCGFLRAGPQLDSSKSTLSAAVIR